jgi:hypothetical protein
LAQLRPVDALFETLEEPQSGSTTTPGMESCVSEALHPSAHDLPGLRRVRVI